MSKAKPRALDTDELIVEIICKHLEKMAKAGHFPPWCESHMRNHIGHGDEGEFCEECAAEGFSGELVHFHADGPAIEMAEEIVKTLGLEKIPNRLPWTEKEHEEKWAVESNGYIYPCGTKVMAVREADKAAHRQVVRIVIHRGEKPVKGKKP